MTQRVMNRLKSVLIAALLLLGSAARGPAEPATALLVLDPARTWADRLEILDLLRGAHPYPDGWSDHREGLAVQANWQDESGRDLLNAEGELYGWWPNVNWTLVVWPLQILQKYRGEFPGVSIVGFQEFRFQVPASLVGAVLA